MFLDLNSRETKFEKERQKRVAVAKKKRDDEQMKAIDREIRQQELNELARQNAEQRELQLQAEEEKNHLEQLLTGGIICEGQLIVIMDETGAEDDRVILPQSYFEKLNSQDAFSKGIVYFRITSLGNIPHITHAGVREFTAPDGVIIVPRKIMDSLEIVNGEVRIKYVRLPKITSVKLQPIENKFYKLENIKLVLEDNLRHHSTLSMGDIITVWLRGEKYTLRVTYMTPDIYGTLIDTDVEVDLDESVEYKTHIAEQVTNQVKGGYTLGTGTTTTTHSGCTDITPIHNTIPMLEEILAEPSADQEGIIQCKFRLSGISITRKFLDTDKLSTLFNYLRWQATTNSSFSQLCDGKLLQLTMRFPTKIFTEDSIEVITGQTLKEVGIHTAVDFIVSMK